MDINEEENSGYENFKETIAITGYGGSETTGECGILQIFGGIITNGARRTRGIKSRILMAKAAFKRT